MMFYQPGMMFHRAESPPPKKTLDLGVLDGAEDLWRKKQLLDYTLKVQDQEFRVHKFVLASVSDFFRAMFSTSMSESSSDSVELKGVSPSRLSRLLKFIYTGERNLIKSNPKEMLECAVYFQMPTLIQQCKESIMNKLSATNCIEFLATFELFSMNVEAEKVRDFIKNNMETIRLQTKPADLSVEWVRIIIDNWKRPEWELFQYIRSWINCHFASRKKFTSDLMSQVRFCLMTPPEIAGIQLMREYKHAEGGWKQLVDQAAIYHQQSILLQVSDDSKQSKVRYGKTPLVINTGPNPTNTSSSYVLGKDKKKRSIWKNHDQIIPPEGPGKLSYVIEVNNFLITCGEFGEVQRWNIFDPRNMRWYDMDSMRRPKDEFAMVYQNKHLYVLGGARLSWSNQKYITDTIDVYSFQENRWRSGGKLPVAVKNHAACVINNSIYISGGDVANGKSTCVSAELHCLDLQSGTWNHKAAMPNGKSKHQMSVMTVAEQEVIVVIDKNLQITYYDLQTNQWSTCKLRICKHYSGMEKEDKEDAAVKDLEHISYMSDSIMLTSGNSVFLLNLIETEEPEDDDDYWDYMLGFPEHFENSYICVKWKFSTDEQKLCQFAMNDFPIRRLRAQDGVSTIGAVLAIPEEADVGVTEEGTGRGQQNMPDNKDSWKGGNNAGRGRSHRGRGRSQQGRGGPQPGRGRSERGRGSSGPGRGRSQQGRGGSRTGRGGPYQGQGGFYA